MKIVLYTDNTLALPIEQLCQLLNTTCRSISFSVGAERVRIDSPEISCPDTYDGLPKSLLREAARFDLAVIFTNVEYDNNYFYEFDRPIAIVSFSGWNLLTDLPVTNGAVFFTAVVLNHCHDIGDTHYETTGCINDFRQDKTTVDLCMRAAFLCRECRDKFEPKKNQKGILDDIDALLDCVSQASRSHRDVLSISRPTQLDEPVFDVFLCHNSGDKPAIYPINNALKAAGISTWLDDEQLAPGIPWQAELEKQIGQIKNAAVFVGKNGIGPWQSAEIRAFLSEFNDRGCPVIPVILRDAEKIPELPIFLKQMSWIDLRKNYQKNLLRLIGALRRK